MKSALYKTALYALATSLILTLGIAIGQSTQAQTRTKFPTIKSVMTKNLDPVDHAELRIARIEFPPGASSPAHEHPGQVFVYVLEGTVVSQLKGGAEETFEAGESFYEPSDAVHTVARNPSETESAAILTIMVAEKGKPSTTLHRH